MYIKIWNEREQYPKGYCFLRTKRIFKESSIYVLSHVKSGAIMGKVYVTVYQGRKEYGHC